MDGLEPTRAWAGLWAVGRVESIREGGDKIRTECRPDLGSVTEVARLAEAVRGGIGVSRTPSTGC
jgi:hypothetical protein